ncbi:oligopeptidase PepB [Exiguobacterium sp. Leaf187]|uniref:Oligopeptidase F n=1 Tax=Exiguobacterium indicum TaxID=296995 RepID=A0A0V8GK27_9BACL|nr:MULTISPECIES: oligoendopeptidase F [Exiguobacterium]AHA30271.1 oligopeptidase PepB [Exiguobacterium sp. MH3]KQS19507.1 oligopeptidase PepB [Exiguobacterium sp. Leaf187]KSU50481.1 oligopeptidase PepB [Exiguobacterium enclense]KTR26335.1 oligopeptidase PepB [Exiguobacterium indicum]MCQ4089718.1 oligoendopeptidase F [Exiguobacterium sp. LL15]
MAEVLTRQDVDVTETWNLESIYATNEAWEEEFESVKAMLPLLVEYKGRLGQSAETLYEGLQLRDEVSRRLYKLYTYAHMRYDENTADSFYQAMNDRARTLASQIGATLAFMTPELLAVPESTIETYLNENPDLAMYRHAFDELNQEREHVLTEAEEAILAKAGEVLGQSGTTFGMLNNADLTFPKIKGEDGEETELTHGRFITFLESSDRSVREAAFKAMYGTYAKYTNTLASTLAGSVKKDNFYADVRKFPSARAAALHGNAIPESVYDGLVEAVHEHLPLLHRYVALRKRVLGLDELHVYDMYTPLVSEVEMKVSYEEAKQLMVEGLAPLGTEYKHILEEGLSERWVDVRETRGKRSGAYSSGAYDTQPFILMNWQDNINNLFTLAHEFGHSVHSYYTRKSQPYPYGDYSIFVAEVASTTNEALLNDYLLKKVTDRKEKLYLLNNQLETFRGTLFRQTMFAEFEHAIHDAARLGQSLTPEFLTSTYYALNQKYFGEEIVLDEEIGLEWARIPHFYYNYYVYQYATGISAAAALTDQILEEGQPAVERYINNFLKAGSSDYPIEVLKAAGVDMTTKAPVEAALRQFERVLDEFEALLAE